MKRLLLLLLCVMLLTGCTALPAEERAFAVVLGLDRADGQWRVHARIPTYQSGGGYATVSGRGDTLPSALADLDVSAPMHLHLGQLRMLVFSRGLAGTGDFRTALDTLAARHDLRLQAQLALTEDELPRLMDAMKPASGTRLSKSLDVLTETRREQGMLMPSTLSEVIRMGERQSPVLPALTLDGKNVDIIGGWPVNLSGMAGERLSMRDMQLLFLMSGGSFAGALTLDEGSVMLSSAGAELQMVSTSEAAVTLTLRCTTSSLSDAALSDAAARACLSVLNRLTAANCDALGLARKAVQTAPTMEAWHDIGWSERFTQVEWTVRVGVEGPA